MVLGGIEKCRLKSKQVRQSVDHSQVSMCKKIKTGVGHMLPGITINHVTPKSTIESFKSDTEKKKNAQIGGQIEKILNVSQNIGTVKDQNKSENERLEERANLILHDDLKQPNKRNAKFQCKRGKTKSKENAASKKDNESYTFVTIPVTVKPLVSPLITVLPTSCHSNALSDVPMVLKIPVQIKTGVSAKTSAYSGQPLKTNTNIQQVGTRELNSEHKKLYWSNNNPAFVTPPHVTHLSELKPPAAPILFPRMTPETPSDSVVLPDSTTLHSVTRKLM